MEGKLAAAFLIAVGAALGFLGCFALAKPRMDAMNAKISLLASKINELSKQIESIEAKAEELAAENKALREQLSSAEERAAALEGELQKARSEAELLRSQLSIVTAERDKLREDKEAVESKLLEAEAKIKEMKDLISQLEDALNQEKMRVEELEHRVAELESSRDRAVELMRRLNESYLSWLSYALSYLTGYWNYSLARCLADYQLEGLKPIVAEATKGASDCWEAYYMLYQYVVENIEYGKDQPVPFPPSLEDLYTSNVTYTYWLDVVQSPLQVLETREGDCEDQAILLLAMITCYDAFIEGENYTTWLALIDFTDTGHAAVFVPAANGYLMILDPAGKYATREPLPSRRVLEDYAEWWREDGSEIERIALVEYHDGLARVVFNGTINELVEFLST